MKGCRRNIKGIGDNVSQSSHVKISMKIAERLRPVVISQYEYRLVQWHSSLKVTLISCLGATRLL